MRIVVQKYGGSSVSDVDRIRRVAARIARTRAEGVAVVVVVSAMGKTTDELIALARSVTPAPDLRELDMLVSVGERITMALLAMALRAAGTPARSLTGSQSGIVTDESHADARVVEVRPERLRQVLEAGEVAIVAGFQGVSRTREVTTLGRGGSDTTAVVLAAALGAEHAEICSDVDGVLTADPRTVPGAVRLETLGLDETLALSRGGAKVLFEDAVRYARDHGVAIVATSTFGPGAGTRLTTTATPRTGAAAVAADTSLVAVDAGTESAIDRITSAGGRVRRRIGDRVHVDVRNAHGGLPADLGAVPIAVVTAAGSGLGERPRDVLRGDLALDAAGIAILDRGASGDQAWWQVPVERIADAARAVHAVLVAR
jgi:aspartate kinase